MNVAVARIYGFKCVSRESSHVIERTTIHRSTAGHIAPALAGTGNQDGSLEGRVTRS